MRVKLVCLLKFLFYFMMVSCNCSLNAICINDCHPRIVILTSSTGEPACWPADFPCLTELEGLKICVIVKKIDSKVQWNIGMITQPLWTTNIVEQAFITDINIPSGLYSWTCSYSWNMTNSSHKCLTIFIIIWSYTSVCNHLPTAQKDLSSADLPWFHAGFSSRVQH